MRTFLLLLVALAGCGPGFGGIGGGPGGYMPPPPAACTPVEPTLTALAIGHADGRPFVLGDAPDLAQGGQGLTMAHFTIHLVGTVPDCIAPSVSVDNHADYNARNPTPTADGAIFEDQLGPVDAGSFWMRATAGGKSAAVQVANGAVQSIE